MAGNALSNGKNCVEEEIFPGSDVEVTKCMVESKTRAANLVAKVQREQIIPATTHDVVPELRLDEKSQTVMPTFEQKNADALAEQKEVMAINYQKILDDYAEYYGYLKHSDEGPQDKKFPQEFSGENFAEFVISMYQNPAIQRNLQNTPVNNPPIQRKFESVEEMQSVLKNNEIKGLMETEFQKFMKGKGVLNSEAFASFEEILFFVADKNTLVTGGRKSFEASQEISKKLGKELSLESTSQDYIENHAAFLLVHPAGIAAVDPFREVLDYVNGTRSELSLEGKEIVARMTQDINGNTEDLKNNVDDSVTNIVKLNEKGEKKMATKYQTKLWGNDSLFQLACAKIAEQAAEKLKGDEKFESLKNDPLPYHSVSRNALMKWDGSKLEESETIGRLTLQNFVIDQVVRSTAMLSFLANTMGAWAAAGGNVGDFVNNMVSNEYIWMSSAAMYLSFHGVINNGLEKLGDPNNKSFKIMKESLKNKAYEKIFQHVEEVKMYQSLGWEKGVMDKEIDTFWEGEEDAEKAENKGEDGKLGLKKKAEMETAQNRFLDGEKVDAVAHKNVAYAGEKTPSQKQIEENRKDRFVGFVAKNLRSSLAGDSEKTRLAKAEEIVGRMTTENTNAFSNDNQEYREEVMKGMGRRLGTDYDLVANLDAMHLLALAKSKSTKVENVV